MIGISNSYPLLIGISSTYSSSYGISTKLEIFMCGKCFTQEFLFVAKVVIIDWKAGVFFFFLGFQFCGFEVNLFSFY
jgi:hypothetical protein